MNLTLGFISFFISIIIPGLLFRRFFFYGEFSKQFNTKDPVLHSIFFSIVPGIFVQITSFFIYFFVFGLDTSFLDIFTIFRDVTSDGINDTAVVTQDFINNDLITFFVYSLFVFLLAIVFGFLSSRLIRLCKWDKKYKLFRFKNQWYYIFSGELLHMKKFKDAQRLTYNKNEPFKHDISTTYADILVSISEEKRELYTGYVVDYDLKSEDTTQLDKIYLIDTHRYKKRADNKVEEEVNDTEKEHPPSRLQKKIPGDVFILDADNIININLTYVPSFNKFKEKNVRAQKRLSYMRTAFVLVVFLIILYHFIYKLIPPPFEWLENYMVKTSVGGKIVTILFINQLFSFIMPFEDKQGKLSYPIKNKYFIYRIVLMVIWGILFYHFVIKNL